MVHLKGKERAGTAEDEAGDEAELKNNIVRALIGMVEIWMDPSYDLWYEAMHLFGLYLNTYSRTISFDPAAEKTCEDLLNLALRTDAGNGEALQALASVRMSQQRPEEAKECLEKAWLAWKDLDPGIHSSIFH
jgi:hypothetical protein